MLLQARDDLIEALFLQADYIKARLSLANVYFKLNDYEQCIVVYSQV